MDAALGSAGDCRRRLQLRGHFGAVGHFTRTAIKAGTLLDHKGAAAYVALDVGGRMQDHAIAEDRAIDTPEHRYFLRDNRSRNHRRLAH